MYGSDGPGGDSGVPGGGSGGPGAGSGVGRELIRSGGGGDLIFLYGFSRGTPTWP